MSKQTHRIEKIKSELEFLGLKGMKEIQSYVNTIVEEMIELNIQ